GDRELGFAVVLREPERDERDVRRATAIAENVAVELHRLEEQVSPELWLGYRLGDGSEHLRLPGFVARLVGEPCQLGSMLRDARLQTDEGGDALERAQLVAELESQPGDLPHAPGALLFVGDDLELHLEHAEHIRRPAGCAVVLSEETGRTLPG